MSGAANGCSWAPSTRFLCSIIAELAVSRATHVRNSCGRDLVLGRGPSTLAHQGPREYKNDSVDQETPDVVPISQSLKHAIVRTGYATRDWEHQ
jgi:hypothetical protein